VAGFEAPNDTGPRTPRRFDARDNGRRYEYPDTRLSYGFNGFPPPSYAQQPNGVRPRPAKDQPLLLNFDRVRASPKPPAPLPRPVEEKPIGKPSIETASPSLSDLVLPPVPVLRATGEAQKQTVLENGSATSPLSSSSGEKAKALDILEAVRTLQRVERERRLPDQAERRALSLFGGFGAVALSLFPDPVTGQYKSPAWEALGQDLTSILSPEEYESAKRTTFNAFYTSPLVVSSMYEALSQLGVPKGALFLEPGCGSGNFMALAPAGMRFIGVEMDQLSGRIARALYPSHDIRIENFRDTRLLEGRIDAVIGNPPFADVKLEYAGMRLSLHDYFFAKSLDALKSHGVLALVTSHFTLDKRNGEVREYLASKADFLGAIRLPSDAFKKEGTAVVTDIVFLRKRPQGEPPRHVDAAWLEVGTLAIEGVELGINRYFLDHTEIVLAHVWGGVT
jgi:hypothetical protein